MMDIEKENNFNLEIDSHHIRGSESASISDSSSEPATRSKPQSKIRKPGMNRGTRKPYGNNGNNNNTAATTATTTANNNNSNNSNKNSHRRDSNRLMNSYLAANQSIFGSHNNMRYYYLHVNDHPQTMIFYDETTPCDQEENNEDNPFSFEISEQDTYLSERTAQSLQQLYESVKLEANIYSYLQHLAASCEQYMYLQQKNVDEFYEVKKQTELAAVNNKTATTSVEMEMQS
eukprot:scaffold1389_cov251-Ochromonas_danica.AAC.20